MVDGQQKEHYLEKQGIKQEPKTLENISQAAINLGIEHLTVYAFSTENWKRSEEEIKGNYGFA